MVGAAIQVKPVATAAADLRKDKCGLPLDKDALKYKPAGDGLLLGAAYGPPNVHVVSLFLATETILLSQISDIHQGHNENGTHSIRV